MNTNKKINRIILCICSILVVFASIFAFIPFNKETKKVYADTSYTNFTFYGSPLYTKVGTYRNDEFTSTIYDVALSYNFSTDSEGYINRIGFSMSFYLGGITSRSFDVSENMGILEFSGTYDYKFFYQFSNSRLMGVPIGYNLYSGVDNYGVISTFVNYFDADGNFLMLSHQFMSFEPEYYLLPIRTYYFDTALDLSTNEYYEIGYKEGYRDGGSYGYDEGYELGYLRGENNGYNLGYNTALENDDRYNFTNLIASVIDVPVKTFTSLFNFEILGVNLSGFFLGLLTCCIVIGVVRLIL